MRLARRATHDWIAATTGPIAARPAATSSVPISAPTAPRVPAGASPPSGAFYVVDAELEQLPAQLRRCVLQLSGVGISLEPHGDGDFGRGFDSPECPRPILTDWICGALAFVKRSRRPTSCRRRASARSAPRRRPQRRPLGPYARTPDGRRRGRCRSASGRWGPRQASRARTPGRGRPGAGSWTISASSPTSATSTIARPPSLPRATPRSPSTPNRIGLPACRRIWFASLTSFSVSAANAPSLNTGQFW